MELAFKTGDKAIWRGNIPVVIVDGYEGMPHKRTIKMDVEGDVFHWDVKIEELQPTRKSSLPQPVIDAYREYMKVLSYTHVSASVINDLQGKVISALGDYVPFEEQENED